MSSRLTKAITCILAGTSGSAVAAAAQGPDSSTSAGAAGTDSLQEIVVTAQRRTENIQDVPISIQAFTAQTIQQLNIATFDDYIKFLPNVTSANNGPGQNEVFMRGLSAGSQASQARPSPRSCLTSRSISTTSPDKCRTAISTSTRRT